MLLKGKVCEIIFRLFISSSISLLVVRWPFLISSSSFVRREKAFSKIQLNPKKNNLFFANKIIKE